MGPSGLTTRHGSMGPGQMGMMGPGGMQPGGPGMPPQGMQPGGPGMPPQVCQVMVCHHNKETASHTQDN